MAPVTNLPDLDGTPTQNSRVLSYRIPIKLVLRPLTLLVTVGQLTAECISATAFVGAAKEETMRLKSKIMTDVASQGFTEQNDLFQRQDLARRITSTLANLEHGSVSVLNGRWGIGKTTFAKQWVLDLQKQNIPAIYFDAFAYDYLENPFQAVAGCILEAAADAGRKNTSAYRHFLAKAAAVGKTVASTATKIGVKAATLGVIGAAEMENLTDLKESISDSLGDFSEKQMALLLENQAKEREKFTELRRSLLTLPDLLSPSKDSALSDAPLIILIDELDRCRPDFALGIVETLKHFFRSDRLHFVLITNLAQLEAAVKGRYGQDCLAREYLQKFYDFIIYFDQSYDKNGPRGVEVFVRNLVGELLPPKARGIGDTIISISSAYGLSLRQIEALSTNISISYLAHQERELRIDILLCFIALFKTISPDLYADARSGILASTGVAALLRSGQWDDSLDIERVITIFDYYCSKNLNENDDRWRGFGGDIWKYNISRLRVIPYLCNLLERFGAPPEMPKSELQ